MKTKRLVSVFFVAACLYAGQGNAALVSADWSAGSGDGWLTRDTISGLDWLDVTLTVNQTFDQVRTGMWYSQGFRHATASELNTLFNHAGTPDDNFDTAYTYPDETRILAQLLGLTITSPDRESAYGFTGTDYFGNDITVESHPIGVTFDALLGKLDYISLVTGLIGEAHFTGGHPFSDQASSNYGSFLVRATPVPVPAAIWLFGSGVLGLAASIHRKKIIKIVYKK